MALYEALNLSRNLREGVVGSKDAVNTAIAAVIRDLASINPNKARILLDNVVKDIQTEYGRHAIEIHSIRRQRDKALYEFGNVLLSIDRTCDQYVAEFSENIEDPNLRCEAIMLCIRAACEDNEFDRAENFLGKLEG